MVLRITRYSLPPASRSLFRLVGSRLRPKSGLSLLAPKLGAVTDFFQRAQVIDFELKIRLKTFTNACKRKYTCMLRFGRAHALTFVMQGSKSDSGIQRAAPETSYSQTPLRQKISKS